MKNLTFFNISMPFGIGKPPNHFGMETGQERSLVSFNKDRKIILQKAIAVYPHNLLHSKLLAYFQKQASPNLERISLSS
jgi:hypothetical protein